METGVLNVYKRILISQLISLIFAVISNIHTEILLKRDWMFVNETIFYMQIILLAIVFSVVTMKYMDGKWINVLLISIPYFFYWLIVLSVYSEIFPTYTEPDKGIGLIAGFVSAYQWISVAIGSIVGTYIKRKIIRHNK